MRNVHLHEEAAFLALALAAGACSVKIRLASSYSDLHEGTDLFLQKRGMRKLRVDLTEGHRQTRNNKFKQNKERKKRGGYWVWILSVPREDVISIGADSCFGQAWRRLKTYKPVAFSPQDTCPEHGEKCPLVVKLRLLGRFLISGLPPDWQALFE